MGANRVNSERLTAQPDNDFILFLIGFRINKWWKIHKWLPIIFQMMAMLKELSKHKDNGLLHYELFIGRSFLVVQYWKSFDALMDYATRKGGLHVKSWQKFNEQIGQSGDAGIFHETYKITPDNLENIYVNMPSFGLGAAFNTTLAKGSLHNARAKMGNTAE